MDACECVYTSDKGPDSGWAQRAYKHKMNAGTDAYGAATGRPGNMQSLLQHIDRCQRVVQLLCTALRSWMRSALSCAESHAPTDCCGSSSQSKLPSPPQQRIVHVPFRTICLNTWQLHAGLCPTAICSEQMPEAGCYLHDLLVGSITV
jgi:hypothetical protein